MVAPHHTQLVDGSAIISTNQGRLTATLTRALSLQDRPMLYFAYGSNMSVKRLTDRVSSARKIVNCELKGHKLAFHKINKNDGSAKCDIPLSDSDLSTVFGVIFDVADEQISVLDRAEGLGNGYESKEVVLIEPSGALITAMTYYATSIDDSLKPYHWYKHHVLVGARENGLPESYVDFIESVESVDDPCPSRTEEQMAVYR